MLLQVHVSVIVFKIKTIELLVFTLFNSSTSSKFVFPTTMKQVFFLLTLLTLALADKPAPTYKASATASKTVKAQAKSDIIQERQSQYGAPVAPAQDSYGSPAAPAQDSYGSPAADPVGDSYGSPQAEVKDSYGSPKADPVAPPAQGNVGTQGYYYYYYPVASSTTGGSGGYAGHKTGTASSSGGGGLLGGGLGLAIVGGLALLVVLVLIGASVFGSSGRSFMPDFSALAPYTDELTDTIYDALKVYAELNNVETAR